MQLSVKLEGAAELSDKLEKMAGSVHAQHVESTLLKAAKIVAEAARNKAPRGPTGNLKRSLVAKLLKRRGTHPATAIAAVDRKKAPHAYLVEYGTSERYKKTGQYTGIMAAHPFFRPAWDEKKPEVERMLKGKLKDNIEGATK